MFVILEGLEFLISWVGILLWSALSIPEIEIEHWTQGSIINYLE